jgi:hypothetical protein
VGAIQQGTVMRLFAIILFFVIAAFFIFTGQNSMVDWQSIKPVVIQSDDWGLCGFFPETTNLTESQKEILNPGDFPAVYWTSTLEDSTDVAVLSSMLKTHIDRDGLPALFQANYITSSLQFNSDCWNEFNIPELHPAYKRPGLWNAVKSAIDAGTWKPELHGRWHYDPRVMKNTIPQNSLLADLNKQGVLLFPGCMSAFELGKNSDIGSVNDELQQSVEIFKNLFGYIPNSVIAPDYVWNGRDEKSWKHVGIKAIQAKREQRWQGDFRQLSRIMKLLERSFKRIYEREIIYIERNCRLETAQSSAPETVTINCYEDVIASWSLNQPAVIETHRINFVSLISSIQESGVQALDDLLSRLQINNVVWLCDDEISQLAKTGTSFRIVGEKVIFRNYTHSGRLINFPLKGSIKTVFVPAQDMLVIPFY